MQKRKRVKKPNSPKKHSFDYGRNIKLVNNTPVYKKSVNEFKEDLYIIKYSALEIMLSTADGIIDFLENELRKEYECCKFHTMTREEMMFFGDERNGRKILNDYIDDLHERIHEQVTIKYKDMIKESKLELIGSTLADLCEYHRVKFIVDTGLPPLVPMSVCASIATHEMNYMQNFSNELAEDLNRKSQELMSGMITQLKRDIYNNLVSADLDTEEDNEVDIVKEIKEKFEYRQKTYKELNDLAESKGWKYVRNNGDHGIFKHPNRDMLLIIPQGRAIGKGLQIFIEKSM